MDQLPSRPRAVGSVPSFPPVGAGPFGIELVFGAGAVDIGAASFIWSGCAGEALGALVGGIRSALTAGTAQKVAATISAHSCWLAMRVVGSALAT